MLKKYTKINKRMHYLELAAGVVDGVLVVFPSYLINKNAPF
jgi:hypothetical protein